MIHLHILIAEIFVFISLISRVPIGNIYQTLIFKHLEVSKKFSAMRRTMYFELFSRCLEMRLNTVFRVLLHCRILPAYVCSNLLENLPSSINPIRKPARASVIQFINYCSRSYWPRYLLWDAAINQF